MTSHHLDDIVMDMTVRQVGLVSRAIDVHRQAQVRKLGRTTSPTECAAILLEIEDLAFAGNLFKQAELELLQQLELLQHEQ